MHMKGKKSFFKKQGGERGGVSHGRLGGISLARSKEKGIKAFLAWL